MELKDMQGPHERRPGFPFIFFAATFGFSWLMWLFPLLASRGALHLSVSIQFGLVVAGACGPLVSVFSVLFLESGAKAVLEFGKRSLRYRIGFFYLGLVLLCFPLLGLIAAFLHNLTGDGPSPRLQVTPIEIPIDFVFLFFLGGSVQEEFGWAYAIDRMQRKQPALAASIV